MADIGIPVVTLVILYCTLRECSALSCYECSDTFKKFWKPKDCETNVTNIPTRECNSQQQYCLVKRVSVKEIVTEIVRDCTEDCRYGCEATSFGITKMTCVSCCDTDNCNTGSTGHRSFSCFQQRHLFILYFVLTIVLPLVTVLR